MKFARYETDGFYDEIFDADGKPRPHADLLIKKIESLPDSELARRQAEVERSLLRMGITFNVYGDEQGTEKIWPFDIIPRIVAADEWEWIERGLKQRIRTLNLFIDDVYNEQKCVRDGVVPEHVIAEAKSFLEPCRGMQPPHGIWCHITGIDLVRSSDGKIYVLEDNLRCPSGVSYVLQNRMMLKRSFGKVFEASNVRPVVDYPSRLLRLLEHLAPSGTLNPTVVVLTPGVYNSAYYEHSFLAQQMGVELVEGRDLSVRNGFVHMRTTKGFQRVDIIYRRIDDDFLDPQVFRPDSMLGVPGLMEVYRAGRVALANAPGTGIADDKVAYATVDDITRQGLHEFLDMIQSRLNEVGDAIYQTFFAMRPDDVAVAAD